MFLVPESPRISSISNIDAERGFPFPSKMHRQSALHSSG
jgi:hypothetical protein